MIKLKFLILFIAFIQVVPSYIDIMEAKLLENISDKKCSVRDGKFMRKENTAQCIERNPFLAKEDNGSKCCFLTYNPDPIVILKKEYGENWKKIFAQKNGYDLNISEDEVRKKFKKVMGTSNVCQYITKDQDYIYLYEPSLIAIDGIVKYDCGEGPKVFNKKEFNPKNKEEILDKQLVESFILSYTEKDCLKRGTKLSDDDYQSCWCEIIPLSSEGENNKICIPFKTSTFQESFKKFINRFKKDKAKMEFKCTCTNNKSKSIKGRFNTIADEINVEIN